MRDKTQKAGKKYGFEKVGIHLGFDNWFNYLTQVPEYYFNDVNQLIGIIFYFNFMKNRTGRYENKWDSYGSDSEVRDASRPYLLNLVFVASLFLLLINDFYLKAAVPSFITGKLSDVSGLVVFVLFFTFLVGIRFKKSIFIFTALLFCWWKSSLSGGFILGWNSLLPFYIIERTLDYTDLFCLLVLVPLYFYEPKNSFSFRNRWIATPVLILTVFAISATSRARDIGPYSSSNNKMYVIHETFKIKHVTHAEFLEHLALSNMKVDKKEDAAPPSKPGDYRYYILKNFQIMDGINVESMYIGVKEKNGNLKVLIQNVTLYDPPVKPDKEVEELLKELFEDYFAIGE
jgi:hypothetical protein